MEPQDESSSSSSAAANGHARPPLPDRAVTEATIEDAYVGFIFHCNPALPLDAVDTESLREAFRNPPRSGGKVFDPFAIYQLVQRFYGKEIKTWTDLTIRLGVEPPDPSKDESAQKIAQYGVRLKKWMHSMHVKSFFEYLMGMPNDYWTNIPSDPNPLAQAVRDGVAVEDDMALRALLPHIRPKRGRKRPEGDEASNPAAQRQRLSPGSAVDDVRQQQWQNTPVDPRSAMPLDRAQTPSSAWPPHDTLQTPLTRWPSTPSTRSGFWDESMDPGSALTPSKAKAGNQRRGAKNVSSAWKLGGQETGSKTRGRPPINRTPIDTPSTASVAWPGVQDHSQASSESPGPMPAHLTNGINTHSVASPESNSGAHMAQQAMPQHLHDPQSSQGTFPQYQPPQQQQQESQRPARPSISLQVPQRTGGSVRLATPPSQPQHPQESQHHSQAHAPQYCQATDALPTYDNLHAPVANSPRQPNSYAQSSNWHKLTNQTAEASQDPGATSREESIPEYFFETMEDRTNIDPLIAYFTRMTHASEWFDADDNPTEPASMEEVTAIINATLENMYRTAASSQAFLINLAALAGARMLMTNLTRCVRLGERGDHTAYRCEWEYRFGQLHGYFHMAAAVPFSMWRAPQPKAKADGGARNASESQGSAASTAAGDSGGAAEGNVQQQQNLPPDHWQNKYMTLLGEMEKMDVELFRLRNKVMDSLKPEPREQ